MSLIDAFSGNAFRMSSLADSINIVPNTYGRVRELGLFRAKPIPTKTFQIEFKNGVLNLLSTAQRGGNAGSVGKAPKRNVRNYSVFHIPHEEFIYADDIQDIRAYGSEYQLQALQDLMNDKLETLASKFDVTEEWHLVNAIQGKMIDADGSVLFNAFTDFGVTEKSVNFDFANVNADIGEKLVEVVRHMEDNALGETMTGVHGLVDSAWFDAFIKHASVKEAYNRYSSIQEPLREDVRRRFVHKGVIIEEYRGTVPTLNADDTSTSRKFIPTNKARFFPVGTRQSFSSFYGPADYLSDANKPGQRLKVTLFNDPEDKFIKISAQTNPFHLCTRPALLVEGAS